MMNRADLLDRLIHDHTTDDLQTLCFKLGVDYRSLKGRTRQAKARELIDLCERTGRLGDLQRALQRPAPPDVSAGPTRERVWTRPEVLTASIGALATVLVAIIGLLGSRPPLDASGTPEPTPVVQAATATAEPTTTAPATPTATDVPLLPATETPTTAPAAAPFQPTVAVAAGLPPDTKAVISDAARAIRVGAQQFPLYIADEFENNDYGWPRQDKTNFGPVNCEFRIAEGAYRIGIESLSGPGWCRVVAPRTAANFLMTARLSTERARNIRLSVMYRFIDDANFQHLTYNQEIQQFAVSARIDGTDHQVVPWTFAADIAKQGANEISVLALQQQVALYFNDQLVVMLDKMPAEEGSIVLAAYLDEAGVTDTLSIDRFELRGN